MSTKIRDASDDAQHRLNASMMTAAIPLVIFHLGGRGEVQLGQADMHRADFLAAVETECGVRIVPADAIVIDRAELPPVTLAGSLPWPTVSKGLPVNVTCIQAFRPDFRPDEAMQMARAWAAIAEYLAAHPPTPPVDEADVEALAGFVRDALGITPETIAAGHLRQGTSDQVARRLLATGRVSVTP